MAKGSAAIATAIWNQNSASVNSSVASGQYFRIRDFSIAETILWFMVKCLLLLWIVYMSGLEMITVIKKLWGKVTFLKSQVLWPHCICWRRVFKKRECLTDAQSYSQVKNDKLKHHLKYHFYVSECQRAQMWEKGTLPHGGTGVWTATHSMEITLATSMKIKISPALWHSYSTSKNLFYKINIFRVVLNDIWRKMLIATLFIVVKHVHQGELVKIMIFIHVIGYRSRCTSPKEKKNLQNRIFYQIEYLILFNFCRKKMYVRCLYRYSKTARTRSIHWCH